MKQTDQMNVLNVPKNKKVFYLDVIRALACLLVVMIHSSMNFAVQEIDSIAFLFGNVFDSMARPGVPLFVMLSGALMLDENYHFTKSKWIRRIALMTLFYVFWSVAYCVVYRIFFPIIKREPVDMAIVFSYIINGHYHLWFIPMIIGTYLLVPILRMWVQTKNIRQIEYFLCLSLLFTFFAKPVVEFCSLVFPDSEKITIFNNLGMQSCTGYVVYFILGWYLANKNPFKPIHLYLMGFVGLLITIVGTYLLFALVETDEFFFYSNFSVNILAYSAAVFSLIKLFFEKTAYRNHKVHHAVSFIAKNSLGIYAVHAFLITVFYRLFSDVYPLFAILAVFTLAMIVSAAVTMIMRRIPVLKNLV
ncbi:MAG: acyltransferase family protein [Clostridia bacterium]|nr:acyltransferase family protein [Clostridia bacterium]